VRLWLSYQRYAIALVLAPAALVVAAAVALPWWAAGALGLAASWPMGFGLIVLRRWSRKLRATHLADRRIAAGRFRATSLRPYCGDPCFRVVAHEILRRAGWPRDERRRLVASLRGELARERELSFVVDHARGVIVTVVDGRRVEAPLIAADLAPPLVR
jgi:hypothetical protein